MPIDPRRWWDSPVCSNRFAIVVWLTATAAASAQWPQWGGLKRNFASEANGLSTTWPESGPKKLWSRSLGEGYSSIVVDDGKLFTMYRQGDDEVVACLVAANGNTAWEHKYAAPAPQGMDAQFGRGPNATPLVHNGKVYGLGVSGVLHCLDARSGSMVWSHDLVMEFGAATPHFGFSSSPLAHKDRLIVAAGGTGTAVFSFALEDGTLQWHKFDAGGEEKGDIYSSPVVINVGGEEQIALVLGRDVIGFDPASGEQRWSHPHVNQWNTNVCTPIWEDGVLFVSSGGEAGSRALKLTRDGATTKVEEAWSTRKMGVGMGSVVRAGEYIYGSSGETPAFVTSVRVDDGRLAWRERGFSPANLVQGDGKLIILDHDGHLAIATPTAEKLTVHAKVQLLKSPAWTVPTLVGKTLYLRDKETILALDLGQG
jgi:outer membrane protein assembly factor BamB